MKNHPKFTLIMQDDYSGRYTILEHVGNEEGIMSRTHLSNISSLEEALKQLQNLSFGPITLAFSSQPIDNSFDI